MKLNFKKVVIAAAVALLCGFTLSAKTKEAHHVTVQEEFKLTAENKRLGYQFTNGGKTINFVCDPTTYKVDRAKFVYVEGSFNGWKKKDGNWLLAQVGKHLFRLEVPVEDVMVPGNSGYPEFKFFIVYEEDYEETVCGKVLTRTRKNENEVYLLGTIPGYQMATNNLILLPEDDANYVVQNNKLANKVKKLKEFNLDNPEDVADISNFRLVPGTTKLFRGYHPYKASRSYDTEETRMRLVNKQLKDNGVKSIITLSGDETLGKNETMSVYVTDIRSAGNQLFVNTHYNTVYYQSTSKDFGELIGEIVRFINSHPGPYYVHCRLGTDRTGVVSAVLAALCGASWNDIAADYQKSNNMGIKEFRDYKLLQYSFEQILGNKVTEVENLQGEMADYFTGRNFLTKDDVEKLKANLQ